MVTANLNASSGPVWLDYIDIDEAKQWIGLPQVDVAAYPPVDARLQLIVSMACDWVQSFLGRPIAPTRFDYRFDGWSGWQGAYLMLPYYPVLEITSVIEYWGVSGPHDLTESTPDNQVDGWQCEYPVGRLTRVFPGLVQKPWFPGSRNIEVQWTAGYNPVPAKVLVATLELVKYWWINSQQNSAMDGPGASMSDEYDAPEPDTAGLWAAVPYRITTLLQPLVQVGLG